ncbi:metallophosphoesterase [Echinicola soli]|uniref:metallophosphoesterase n=1 Tax=Echinicola soli TaxID=2591634 RepID=UPI001AEF51C3|nr:metallophosphoesterase [Echinicola soli]
MKRRKFIRNTILGTMGAGILGAAYAYQIEFFWLEFVRKKMLIRNLPAHLTGKSLIQISDIHVGNRFDYRYIIDAFKKARQFKPDVVVYTGDYASYENQEQFGQLEVVVKYAEKGRRGTAGILGNHD